MEKLSPELIHIYQTALKSQTSRSLETPSPEEAASQEIYVKIWYQNSIDPLVEMGFKVDTQLLRIASGMVNPQILPDLAAHPNVIKIDLPTKTLPDLDHSIPDIRADEVWSRSGDTFSGLTGSGVVVGIIDSGIDYTHKSFIKANGDTRILSIWDQTIDTSDSEAVANESAPGNVTNPNPLGTKNLNYGVEFKNDDPSNANAPTINKALDDDNPFSIVRHRDQDGHGTHVAGTAAGNGRQAGNCHGDYHYIGVAPEADLIIVRRIGMTDNDPSAPAGADITIDAIRYILDRANGRPVVINMSFSSNFGPRDGTNDQAVEIDDILNLYPEGVVMVRSAGNQANQERHAEINLPATNGASETLSFQVPGNSDRLRLAAYYSGSNVKVRIKAFGDTFQDWVESGDPQETFNINNGGNATVNNSTDNIQIRIIPQNFGANNVGNNQGGAWELEFENTSATATSLQVYSDRGSGEIVMLDHISTDRTVPPEAAGANVIIVGNHSAEGSTNGNLSSSSGRGPVWVNANPSHNDNVRPHLTAPGTGITAPQTESLFEEGCCCDCCYDFYYNLSGTSMSTPHVAGAVALLLEKDSSLTFGAVRGHLTGNTQSVAGQTLPNSLWGWGKLDIKDASVDVPDPPGNSPRPAPTESDPLTEPVVSTPSSGGTIDTFSAIQERWNQLPGVRDFDRRFRKYFFEIRSLINTNKRVAVVWHRNGGPEMIRMAFRAASRPDLPISQLIGGLRLQTRMERFGEILRRYASPELVADLDRYGFFFPFLYREPSLNELMDQLENQSLAAAPEFSPS